MLFSLRTIRTTYMYIADLLEQRWKPVAAKELGKAARVWTSAGATDSPIMNLGWKKT